MRYRLRLTPSAERQIATMRDLGAAWAVVEFINGPLLDHPYRVGGTLGSRWQGHLIAHVGVYRVVYRVDDDEVIVTVVRIGPRGTVHH